MACSEFFLTIFPGQWRVLWQTPETAAGGAVVPVIGFVEEVKPCKDLFQ